MVRETLSLVAFCAIFYSTGDARASGLYSCQSLGDEVVTLSFTLDSDGAGALHLTYVKVQIEGDMGYATDAEALGDRIRIPDLEAHNGDVRFKLFTADPQYDYPIGELRLVSLSEGVYGVTAGVLQLGGGGVWPIQCDVIYEDN